ncbi:DUF3105 domain-containing protein [Dactylosporangium sp. NPDC050688]|uniref:DUF3105 domain-containing protein n=1 Tax=Dactylosporangium sp. NPDC050688 TaxID=3157217 RepID=UPI0033FFE096
MGSDTYRLGIDFGTSATAASLLGPDGRLRSLLFDVSPLLASAVFVGPDGTVLTGADAERAALSFPAGFEANPKRRIDDTTVWLGERELRVTELIGAVLQRVATEARRVAGRPPADVVITHPATWGRARKSVLAEAARQAGLGEAGLVPEPVAAAAYFASVLDRQITPGRCLVVYDLGAGTFDVSVVRPSAAGFEVVASTGLDDVGGLDLDAAIVRHARSVTGSAGAQWGRLDWPQDPADQQARQLLWRAARAAKEQLSRHAAADLTIPLVDTTLHLTREEFEKAALPVLERTAALTLATLRESGIPREEISGVFLVGGSSRIPLAATVLHRTLGIAPTVIDQPELVVAEGSLFSPVGPGRLPGDEAATPAPAPAIPAVVAPAANTHPVPSGMAAIAAPATAPAAPPTTPAAPAVAPWPNAAAPPPGTTAPPATTAPATAGRWGMAQPPAPGTVAPGVAAPYAATVGTGNGGQRSGGAATTVIAVIAAVAVVVLGLIGFAGYQTYRIYQDKSRTWQDRAAQIDGIVNYGQTDPDSLDQAHSWGPINYKYQPPAGGPHNPNWQRCLGDVYPAPIASEHAVHSLEHGAVWITYHPDLPADQVEALATKVRGRDFMLMSPFPGLRKPISLQAWGYQLMADRADDRRIDTFIAALRQNATLEPGTTCSSGSIISETGTTPRDLGKN